MPVDPPAVAAALVEVAGRYIERLLEIAGPRVVVIDDLHWLDPSSAGWSTSWSTAPHGAARDRRRDAAGPIPGLADARVTSNRSPWPASTSRDGAARAPWRGPPIDADDARRIHERTAGNPLFITETVRALLDDGTLALRDGRLTLPTSPGHGMPMTLRALLGARIDALSPDARTCSGSRR